MMKERNRQNSDRRSRKRLHNRHQPTTITNKYTPGETSATVTKNWDDNNNQDGKRPTEIKVELYQDGKATGKTATLNESNNWTHTWAGLDEKAKGQQSKIHSRGINKS
ncbi:Cna B-type domain-containing protein [Staphylococcus aureus]